MKSLLLSIFGLLLTVGLIFATVYMFIIYWLLGFVGIALIAIFPQMVFRKAANKAEGVITLLFAKWVAPIASAVIALFLILTVFLWV